MLQLLYSFDLFLTTLTFVQSKFEYYIYIFILFKKFKYKLFNSTKQSHLALLGGQAHLTFINYHGCIFKLTQLQVFWLPQNVIYCYSVAQSTNILFKVNHYWRLSVVKVKFLDLITWNRPWLLLDFE